MKSLRTAVLVACLLIPLRASAGAVSRNFDILYLEPFVGVELARFGFAGLDMNLNAAAGEFDTVGLAFGGRAGVRLGPISFGVLYQRTEGTPALQVTEVHMNKLYGELAGNIRWTRWMMWVINLDVGYAFMGMQRNQEVQGVGGKLGLALDFYPLSWLSLGVGAAFDLQAYIVNNQVIGGYGGTFVGRLGFHI